MMGNKASIVDRTFNPLDSAIELTMSSESDYNWIVFVYEVTIDTHIYDIYIFINFSQKFQRIIWAFFIF